MKILFTRFPFESAHGGAEMQTISLMKGLRRRGHAVAFLGSCPTLLVLCQQHQIPCAALEIGPPPVSKETVVSFLWRKRRMRQKLNAAFQEFVAHGLDAICMLSLSEKLLLTQTAAEAGVKVFWIEHDTIGPWLTRNPNFPRLRKLSVLATTIGVSELSQKLYVQLGWDPRRVVGIPNGIDPQRFPFDSAAERQSTEKAHVGCVARLAREKGIDLLIQAAKDIPEATFSIVGLGRQRNALERLIAKYGISDRVSIEPRKANMGGFYHSLDVLVLPSRTHDPFGLVAAEAMMLGVPVIVTDACGIASLLTHGKDALIVRANSAEALKSAIADLLSNEFRRRKIAQAGRQKALSDFTETSMINRYEELLKQP